MVASNSDGSGQYSLGIRRAAYHTREEFIQCLHHRGIPWTTKSKPTDQQADQNKFKQRRSDRVVQ